MKVLGTELTYPPNHDLLAFLLPLQHGTGANTESAPNRRGHGNLPLGRES